VLASAAWSGDTYQNYKERAEVAKVSESVAVEPDALAGEEIRLGASELYAWRSRPNASAAA